MTTATNATRAEICAVSLAELFRDDGEIIANPIGTLPVIGGRLAKETFAPDLLMTDGEARFVANAMAVGVADAPRLVEAWNPYRRMFDMLWSGRRHVVMGATQVDRFGNQNIACIGSLDKPRTQLLGFRGAPGNTINHTTSYWVPKHTPQVFVESVDVVTGIGYDRAAQLGESAARFHEIRAVVSNLGVFDFATPDHSMRLRCVHPGVSVDEVVAATGFDLVIDDAVGESRAPTGSELELIRAVIDPSGAREREVPS